ncbi:unnamed protein product, partial [Amoebophrya sp. A120]|eukprot:GSA120T00018625001.1
MKRIDRRLLTAIDDNLYSRARRSKNISARPFLPATLPPGLSLKAYHEVYDEDYESDDDVSCNYKLRSQVHSEPVEEHLLTRSLGRNDVDVRCRDRDGTDKSLTQLLTELKVCEDLQTQLQLPFPVELQFARLDGGGEQ